MQENIERDITMILLHRPKIVIPVKNHGRTIMMSIDVAKVIEEILKAEEKTFTVQLQNTFNPLPLDYQMDN